MIVIRHFAISESALNGTWDTRNWRKRQSCYKYRIVAKYSRKNCKAFETVKQ
jgi:hypothetical protein